MGNERLETHWMAEQDDQSVPNPDASYQGMFVITGLHLCIAPKRPSRAIAVTIISIHSSYNPERRDPGNRQNGARGGNPNVGFRSPMLTGAQSPHRERLRTEFKAYRSSDHDVPDTTIEMFRRVFPLVIVVDIRWIIYQSLSLILGHRIVDILRPELFELGFSRVRPVSRDPTPFRDVSRSVGLLSVGSISLVHHPARFSRVVNLKRALFKKDKSKQKPAGQRSIS